MRSVVFSETSLLFDNDIKITPVTDFCYDVTLLLKIDNIVTFNDIWVAQGA